MRITPLLLLLVSPLVGSACSTTTSPLPQSSICEEAADCTDPTLPYCVQGACHACEGASSCSLETPRCAVDELTCSGCLDDTDCAGYPEASRCAPTGACVGCLSNAQCANPTPVCDPDPDACRACVADSECASEICDRDTGACVAELDVIYAAPDGSATAPCDRTQPCTLVRALERGTTAPETTFVRLLPGAYAEPLLIDGPHTLRIVATDALLGGAVTIQGGANVKLRGLGVLGQVRCAGAGPNLLELQDVTVDATTTALHATGCRVIADRVRLTAALAVELGDNGGFGGDRLRIEGRLSASGVNQTVSMINSVLTSPPELSPIVTLVPYTTYSYLFAFNTFALAPQAAITCPPTANAMRRSRFDNNIIFSTGPATDSVVRVPAGMVCSAFDSNLTFPQAAPLGGTNRVLDPQLVDVAGGDLTLQATSPAIDAASRPGSDHDFDGAPRPQGAQSDIGAFEWTP